VKRNFVVFCLAFAFLWPGMTLFAATCGNMPDASGYSAALAKEDTAAVKAVIESYRTSWLADDAEGVLKTFTDDAVLLPHHGVTPVVGRQALKDFWWPAGASRVKLNKLEITVDEVGGDCHLAYARGHDAISWAVEEGGTQKAYINSGTYLNILRKMPDGTWRISHHMWDDPANQLQ
jgi:uncharacterized protein (TIGR02246 family)